MEKRIRRAVRMWDWSVAVWICLPFLLGAAVGCLLSVSVCGQSGQELYSFLLDYLLVLEAGVPVHDVFWPVVFSLLFWNGMLLFCLTAVGAVVLPILFFTRGFLFSFSVCCFVQVFGVPGLGMAFVVLGVPAFFWGASLFCVGYHCMGHALSGFVVRPGENKVPWFPFFLSGTLCFFVGCIVECFVVPGLFAAVVRMFF